jgi:hypothetical protein
MRKPYEFALKNIFIKVQKISFLNKYFFIKNKSKLCFEDRVIVKNVF